MSQKIKTILVLILVIVLSLALARLTILSVWAIFFTMVAVGAAALLINRIAEK
jgi:hypothetical protein